MPDTTPKYAFPSPLLTEAPDAPKGIQDLAIAVENTIFSSMPVAASGSSTIGFSNSSDSLKAVTFPVGRFSAPPAVVPFFNNNSSVFIFVSVVVGSLTASGVSFTAIHIQKTVVTIAPMNFTWLAVLF